ncbi:MAG: Uncharacterised protein [Halieaceae bacterium]|nr:MAG: Uncharacterised protein [Halieaceae bacterium]
MDLPRLFSTQQFACAADLHVMGGQLIAGAQIARRFNRLQAFLRIGGDHRLRRAEKVGIGLVMRTPHAAPQLVQLRQAKFISALNDDGVRVGDVDAGLDNRGADENVVMLMVEVRHDLFQALLTQLPVRDTDRQFGQ